MEYKKCTLTDLPDMYKAFIDSFSDYIIPMKMDCRTFISHMFRQEHNAAEHSFLAYDGGRPVGVILGGIRTYEHVLSMRCGTLGVIPPYRGTGVSAALLELHKQEARKENCRRCVLEVIQGNARAEGFYLKHGYKADKTLRYFKKTVGRPQAIDYPVTMKALDHSAFLNIIKTIAYFPIDWQSETAFLYPDPEIHTLGAFINHLPTGVIAYSASGKICFLWVAPEFRRRGIAAFLIEKAAETGCLSELSITVSGNPLLENFILQNGFLKLNLAQTQMKTVVN